MSPSARRAVALALLLLLSVLALASLAAPGERPAPAAGPRPAPPRAPPAAGPRPAPPRAPPAAAAPEAGPGSPAAGPDAPERLQGLLGSLASGDWAALLAMGDVYRSGEYPRWSPDEHCALRLYAACAACPRGDVAALGQQRFVELRSEPLPPHDSSGASLPPAAAELALSAAAGMAAATPYEGWGRLRRAAPPAEPAGAPKTHRSDAQNVHDHSVSAAVRENARALMSACFPGGRPGRGEVEAALEAATDAVLGSSAGAGEKGDALLLLDDLRSGPGAGSPHSTIGATAAEVLCAVWSVLGRAGGAAHGAALAGQLASGVERGKPVCLTGKIGRVLSVLDGLDEAQTGLSLRKAAPMWAVREELGSMAAASASDAERRGDPEGDGGEADFRRRARALYVEELGLSEAVLGPIVEEMSAGFG